MLYGKFIDELLARLKSVTTSREEAGRKINLAYKEVGNITNCTWEPLKGTGEIVTVPNYTTGTCTITNGSRTVTFSGSAITQAMEGRYFKPQGSNNWYKIIKYVSASQFTLLSPIQENSNTNLTFIVWERFYYFPSEARRILDFGNWIRGGALTERSNQYIIDSNTDISLTGDQCEFTMFGVNPFESEYSDGTVTLTKDSNLMTGVGTLWLDNAEPGDIIEVGSNVYRVKRVESDTSIRMINYAAADVATGAMHKIRKDSPLGFQLFYNANQAMILPYTYVKRVYDMVNEDYDRSELPEEFDRAILDGAEADRLADQDDAKWINKQALYAARINDLKATRFVSTPRFRQMRPLIKSRGGYL